MSLKKILELKEERAGLLASARELNEKAEGENRNFNDTEQSEYDKTLEKYEAIGERVERMEKLHEAEKELEEVRDRPQLGSGDQGEGEEEAEKAEKRAKELFGKLVRTGNPGLTPAEAAELRALSSGTDSEGGYTVLPEDFRTKLLKVRDNRTFMRRFGTVLSMRNAKKLTMPRLTDPGDPTWTTEILTGSADATMAFAQFELDPNPLARRILVSRTLLRKSEIDIEGLIAERFGYKFGVVEDNNYLNGDGSSKPLGVFTASASGISTGRDSRFSSATALDADTIKQAPYEVEEGYHPNMRWIMNKEIKKAIAVLKDGDGQYLLTPGLAPGDSEALVGFPTHLSAYAPSTMTADDYVAVLGDFSEYMILEDLAYEFQPLHELYAATNQVGYIMRMEIDGKPAVEEAFVRLQMAAS